MRPARGSRLALLAAALAGACVAGGDAARQQIILGSTTSTQDSGLLDVLVPAFQERHPGYAVKVIAVGTGEALELGRRRDADILLVHAPAAESAFVAQGHGTDRRPVMRNMFTIVGPPEDAAGVRTARSAADAFARIARSGARFISRGDDSGTHRKELDLWQRAGIQPRDDAYTDAGQGMGDVLRIASEKGAYTLSDMSTFLSLRHLLHLTPLFSDDPLLENPYSVIIVRGARNASGARAFADWIVGAEGQALIDRFGRDRFGAPLFIPASPPAEQPTSP